MANAIIAYGNRIDEATLSGGSWLASLPVANLQDRRIGKVARSDGATEAATQFDIDFGQARLLRVFALVGHNIQTAGQYRFRFSNDDTFATTVADSDWTDVWPIVYPAESLPWESASFWTGRYSDEEIEGYNATTAWIADAPFSARYARIEISDETNTDGYIEAGRVFAGAGWQPTRNMIYGASLGFLDRTVVQEATSGAEYFDARRNPRVARFNLDGISDDSAMAYAFEMQRQLGTSGEVLFIWNPGDTTHAIRRQFLGRFRTLSAIENAGPDRWRAPFEVKELL